MNEIIIPKEARDEWNVRLHFADNLKHLLEQRDITQRELAKRTDISPSAISSYITGERYPRPNQLQAIARALDVDPGVLTGLRPASESEQHELMRMFSKLNADDQSTVYNFVKFLYTHHSISAPAQHKRVGVIRRNINET